MVGRHKAPWNVALCVWILALAGAPSGTAALLVVHSEEESGIYPLGREIVFAVKPAEGAGWVDPAKIVVTVTHDGWHKLAALKTSRTEDALEVRFTPEAAGWYLCEAAPAGDRKAAARAGVAVGPEKIAPSMPEPNDFEEFWNARRAALAAMPLTADLAPVESPEPQIACFSLEAPCPQTNPVRGYYAYPVKAKPHSCPAILYLRAAGVSGEWCIAAPEDAVLLAQKYGAIALDINAHGMLNDQPPEYYRDLEQHELRNYWAQGADDRDQFYFVGMYVRMLRAIEFLATRELWDGTHLITIGESQGGGQALAAAGLDARVSAVVAIVPALCDLTGPVADRLAGWPMPLGRDIESEHAKKVIDAVRYCDNVNLARRSRAQTLVFVGLVDTTCSPPGIYAMHNNLLGDKHIVAYPHKPHNGLPKEDLWLGDTSTLQDQFIRRHIGR